MKTITIKQIKCYETEDNTGKDRIHLKIKTEGKTIATLKRSFNDGNTWRVNKSYDFIDNIQLKMMEMDWPDADDHLGTHIIKDNTSLTDAAVSFKRDGANYKLKYDLEVPITVEPQETNDSQNTTAPENTNDSPYATEHKFEKVTRHRDAGTGLYVTKEYADTHKKTTIKETRKK